MNLIHKYEIRYSRLNPMSKDEIYLPRNGQILKVGMQGDNLKLWLIYPFGTEKSEARSFYVIGNNQLIPDGLHYLDTVFDGPYVWHVFEGII